MILDNLPETVRPIVSVIDDWVTNRRLGLIFEARVGRGKLLACSIDLVRDIETRPVARQLKRSLVTYLQSPAFKPSATIDADSLQTVFRPATNLQRLGATIRASSSMMGYPATQALDGDPATIWHTPWGDGATVFPHELVLDLQRSTRLAGIRYLPRQDMTNGWITRYQLFFGEEAGSWGEPVAEGQWKADHAEKTVQLASPRQARYVRLVATAGYDGKPFAAVAELDVVLPDDASQ
jgi:hypothetical protein